MYARPTEARGESAPESEFDTDDDVNGAIADYSCRRTPASQRTRSPTYEELSYVRWCVAVVLHRGTIHSTPRGAGPNDSHRAPGGPSEDPKRRSIAPAPAVARGAPSGRIKSVPREGGLRTNQPGLTGLVLCSY